MMNLFYNFSTRDWILNLNKKCIFTNYPEYLNIFYEREKEELNDNVF